jgi:hypothetical protein
LEAQAPWFLGQGPCITFVDLAIQSFSVVCSYEAALLGKDESANSIVWLLKFWKALAYFEELDNLPH